MDSNSASPTDIWFLTFNDRTTYKGTFIKNAFLKLFIDINNISTKVKDELETSGELYGLNYELNIYKDIIRPIVDLNICPNFVKYLASGSNCSFNSLLNFLKGGKVLNKKHILTDNEVERIFTENIFSCLMNSCDYRSSINTITPEDFFRDNIYIKSKLKFSMILNEQINFDTTKKYSSFLIDKYNLKTFQSDILWETLFQICAGCYAMSLSKTVHNDLHIGNIFVEDLGKKVISLYFIN